MIGAVLGVDDLLAAQGLVVHAVDVHWYLLRLDFVCMPFLYWSSPLGVALPSPLASPLMSFGDLMPTVAHVMLCQIHSSALRS